MNSLRWILFFLFLNLSLARLRRLEDDACIDDDGIECSGNGYCDESSNSCVCYEGFFGNLCSSSCPGTFLGNEESIICNGHGTCNNETLQCNCQPPYHGEGCDQICPGWNEEEKTECNGHGTCEESSEGIFQCVCQEGYFGTECVSGCPKGSDDDGDMKICSGHGTCNEQNDYMCECEAGYYGDACTHHCPGLVVVGNNTYECNGNGKCDTTTFQCECDTTTELHEGDCACLPDKSCKKTGTCQKEGGCFCSDPLTTGKWCQNGCDYRIDCNRHGLCDHDDYPVTHECRCLQGYYGHDCTVECSNEITCNNHGYCDAQGQCQCLPGYSGSDCSDVEESVNTGTIIAILVITILVLILIILYMCTHRPNRGPKYKLQAVTKAQPVDPASSSSLLSRTTKQEETHLKTTTATTLKPTTSIKKSEEEKGWSCPACTYNNPNSATVCRVCKTKRDDKKNEPAPPQLNNSDFDDDDRDNANGDSAASERVQIRTQRKRKQRKGDASQHVRTIAFFDESDNQKESAATEKKSEPSATEIKNEKKEEKSKPEEKPVSEPTTQTPSSSNTNTEAFEVYNNENVSIKCQLLSHEESRYQIQLSFFNLGETNMNSFNSEIAAPASIHLQPEVPSGSALSSNSGNTVTQLLRCEPEQNKPIKMKIKIVYKLENSEELITVQTPTIRLNF